MPLSDNEPGAVMLSPLVLRGLNSTDNDSVTLKTHILGLRITCTRPLSSVSFTRVKLMEMFEVVRSLQTLC
jgi:hypothetical protein